MIIFNSKSVLKVNMFLFLDKPIGINKPFQIDHQYIGKFFKKVSLVSSHGSSILLISFNWLILEVAVQTFFNGALVIQDV